MKRAAFHNSGDEICMVVVVLDTIEMNVWLLIGRIYSGDGDGGVSDKEITNSVFHSKCKSGDIIGDSSFWLTIGSDHLCHFFFKHKYNNIKNEIFDKNGGVVMCVCFCCKLRFG